MQANTSHARWLSRLLIATLLLTACSRAPTKSSDERLGPPFADDGSAYFCLTPADLKRKSNSNSRADIMDVAMHYENCMIDFKAAIPWYERLAKRGDRDAIDTLDFYRKHALDRQRTAGRSDLR